MQNGGFESGQVIWIQSNSYIIDQYYHHSGSWSAWFGGYSYADDRLYQTINIPTGVRSARLTLYLHVYTEEDPNDDPYDYFHVELQNTSGQTLETFLWADNRMSSSGWYVGTMTWNDFSAHAGQSRRLFLRGTNDSLYFTNFFVDDITLWTYCNSLGAEPTGSTWQKLDAPPGYTPVQPTKPKGQ